jgi:hypothetical protein
MRRFCYLLFYQMLGAIVETGEWELLVLFIRYLGGAEGMLNFL